jgi:hypothetical protein
MRAPPDAAAAPEGATTSITEQMNRRHERSAVGFCWSACVRPAAEAAVAHDRAEVVDSCDRGDAHEPTGPQVVVPDTVVLEGIANGDDPTRLPGYPVQIDGRSAWVAVGLDDAVVEP